MTKDEHISNLNVYATPKMIAAAVGGDLSWMYLSHYLDPYFEDDHVGDMAALDFMSIFYPIAIGLGTWLALEAYSNYHKKNDDAADKAENNLIAGNVLLGMTGWMSGFYIATEGMGYDYYDDWEYIALMAGVMSVVPLLVFNACYEFRKNRSVENKTGYLVGAACFFLGSFNWYFAYILPSILDEMGIPEDISRALISPFVAGAGTYATLKVLVWAGQNTAPKNLFPDHVIKCP